jgi:hypothetical protein
MLSCPFNSVAFVDGSYEYKINGAVSTCRNHEATNKMGDGYVRLCRMVREESVDAYFKTISR